MQIYDLKTLTTKISLQPDTHSKSLLPLIKDEVVAGQVLKVLPKGKVTLLIKGRQVTAKSTLPLTPGKLLSFKVENISPFPTLKLLGTTFNETGSVNASMVMSAVKENLWESLFTTIKQSGLPKGDLAQFRALMNDVTWRLFAESNPELLRILIAKSGLGWEAKLRKVVLNKGIKGEAFKQLIEGDLKGMVSKLLGLQVKESALLHKFVSTIKNTQLLNLTSPEQDRKIFLPIPIQFSEGVFTVAQLLIHLPQKEDRGSPSNKEEKDLFRISFLLELSRLGSFRADITIRGKEITGTFLFTTEEAKSIFENNLWKFIDRIEEKGFKIHQLDCRLKDHETVSSPLLNEIIEEGGGHMSLFA
jgi:hypothetical protein